MTIDFLLTIAYTVSAACFIGFLIYLMYLSIVDYKADKKADKKKDEEVREKLEDRPKPEYASGTLRLIKRWDNETAAESYVLQRYGVVDWDNICSGDGIIMPLPVYGWEDVSHGDEEWAKRTREHYGGELIE